MVKFLEASKFELLHGGLAGSLDLLQLLLKNKFFKHSEAHVVKVVDVESFHLRNFVVSSGLEELKEPLDVVNHPVKLSHTQVLRVAHLVPRAFEVSQYLSQSLNVVVLLASVSLDLKVLLEQRLVDEVDEDLSHRGKIPGSAVRTHVGFHHAVSEHLLVSLVLSKVRAKFFCESKAKVVFEFVE